MVSKSTMKVNAPKDIIFQLRMKYPHVRDADLIRMAYNTSMLKLEVKLKDADVKDKMGKFLYGKRTWNGKGGKKK